MSHVLILALLLGLSGGCRTFTPLATVAVAALLELLHLGDTPLAWLASPWAAVPLLLLALAELLGDKHPRTPSRRRPGAVIARIASGGFSGGALAAAAALSLPIGVMLGAAGALIGTYGGFFCRGRLAEAFGRDMPAALVEDWFAVALAISAVALV